MGRPLCFFFVFVAFTAFGSPKHTDFEPSIGKEQGRFLAQKKTAEDPDDLYDRLESYFTPNAKSPKPEMLSGDYLVGVKCVQATYNSVKEEWDPAFESGGVIRTYGNPETDPKSMGLYWYSDSESIGADLDQTRRDSEFWVRRFNRGAFLPDWDPNAIGELWQKYGKDPDPLSPSFVSVASKRPAKKGGIFYGSSFDPTGANGSGWTVIKRGGKLIFRLDPGEGGWAADRAPMYCTN